jgi:hypothetical protein
VRSVFCIASPYHPQRIWADTQFIADLNAPAEIRLAAHSPTPTGTANASLLDHLNVKARLTTPLSSDIAGKGDPVTAVVTKPLFGPQHQLILSEGTELEGAVLQAKPSRSVGRNGQLGFTLRSIKRTGENAEHIHGTLTGAEGNASQNVTVD